MSTLGDKVGLPMTASDMVVAAPIVDFSVQSTDLPAASTKVQESNTKLVKTFNGTGPFTKSSAQSSTFQDFQSQQAGITRVGDSTDYTPTNLTSTQIDKLAPQPATSAKSINQQNTNNQNTKDHIIRLTEKLADGISDYVVYFEVMPEVTEARSISYEAVAPTQFPGAFQKYKGTDSVQWTINATFICRTTNEATKNLEYLNRLRSWSLPYFGDVTAAQFPSKLGAPPPVLIFEGFKSNIIGPVPVVITSLNWSFPKDVDYIPANSADSKLVPFPTVMQLSIQLVESFSTGEFNRLSLKDYRTGNFSQAYSQDATSVAASPVSQGASQPVQEAQEIGARGGNGLNNPSAYIKPASAAAPGAAVSNPKAETKFVSNGGGDFGGGGASSRQAADGGW